MEFFKKNAEIFVPHGGDETAALKKTTHMGIMAHEDDVEFWAIDGIIKSFMNPDAHFTAVVATDGAGSSRTGRYGDYTDEQMKAVRVVEQKTAATVGKYSALVMLQYSSAEMKNKADKNCEKDLIKVLDTARPDIIYTHNLADKHDTHVATVVKTIKALREIKGYKPKHIYGCEGWRGLDWLLDEDKTVFDLTGYDHLANAIAGIYDSQIAGGKRYDLAADGRRRANATFLASHAVDTAEKLTFALELTPLLDKNVDIVDFMCSYVERLKKDVRDRLSRMI